MTRKKRLGRGLEALLNTTEPDHEATIAVIDPVRESEGRIDQLNDLSNGISNGSVFHSDPPPRSEVPGNFIDRNHDGIPDGAQPELSRPTGANRELTTDVVHLSVYDIEDNPFQPRRVFSEPEIVSLAESLKEHDILQPILVRVVDNRYQLISGERRLRAAIKANWQTIPARIRKADDRLVSELAIVENLQRKDLNAIEKALSFRRYIDEHRCTQEDLAKRLKIDRSTIANLMRLLELPPRIQKSVQDGTVSAGHARALLPLGDAGLQQSYCDQIEQEGLSVRVIERMVSERLSDEETFGRSNAERVRKTRDHQIEALQQELRMALGTGVKIKKGSRDRGQIVISYGSQKEFDRLRELLSAQKAQ